MKSALRHLPYLIPLWILCVGVYLKTLQPSLYFIDASVLVTAALKLGIPQPPGYPTFNVLGHLFTYLPFGDVLFRLQVLSILYSTSLATLVYFFAYRLGVPKLFSLGGAILFAFSYQVWSQTLNYQPYTFTDLFIFLALFVLLFAYEKKNSLKLALLVLFLGIASGGSTVMVIMSIPAFSYLLLPYWQRLGLKGFGLMAIAGLIIVVLSYSYLPIRALQSPFQNWGDPRTPKLVWDHIAGAGLNYNDPTTNKVNGFVGDPKVFFQSTVNYFKFLFWQFTPIALPFILLGAYQLFKVNGKVFITLISIPLTNIVIGGLWQSGNLQTWFVISYFVFAVFAGVGIQQTIRNIQHKKLRFAILALIVGAPLVWWGLKLDRSNYHYLKDYADNLYAPLAKDAVVFGIYDTYQAAFLDKHELRADRADVFPIVTNELYVLPWYREHIRRLRPDLVPTEIDSMTTFSNEQEYNDMLNWYAEWLLKKGVPVYITRPVFTKSVLVGSNAGVFSPDPQKLKAIPAGLVERITLVEGPKGGGAPGDPTAPGGAPVEEAKGELKEDKGMDLKDFDFRFQNPQEYKKPPYFLESGYRSSWNDLVSEYALSYIAAAEKLLEVKAPVGQNQGLGGLGGVGVVGGGEGTQDRDKAKELIKKAERIAPESLEVINKLAIVYASQGEFKKTLEYFKKASSLAPENVDLKFNLAKSYLDTGDAESGKALLQEILRQAQDGSPVAKAAASELSNLSVTQQPAPGWQTFTNDAMNLKFFYPEGFAVTFSSESLIKLTNNGVKKDELTFLIYSKQLQPGEGIESISSSLPFVMDGVLLQSQPAGLAGFQSIMRMYGTGPDNIVLLLLKRDQQGFAVRIFPGDSNKGQEFSGILQSIKTLK